MNRLEKFISKWKFKKIAITYIIVTLIVAIGCVAATGIVFKDRISFAWQYARVSEVMEKNDASALNTQIDKLASTSSDVVDILVLDANNKVTYSAKKSEFGSGSLILSKSESEKNYLVSDKSPNYAFKYVKGEEFMFASVFNKNFSDIKDEYKDEIFYENGFANKTIYMLSFLGENDGSAKVYIISNPASVPGGMMTLKIDACVAMLFFMLYWVLLALWVFQNAAKAKLYPLFWGIIVLLTNLAGVIVYALYKRGNITCSACGTSQSKMHIFCTTCGSRLSDVCENCGTQISKKDAYCPHCGVKNK